MNILIEILSPDFLLRDALIGSILLGLICPLVGVYFVLRRMIFLGVALPQISAAGIAAAFWGYSVLFSGHQHGAGGERALALAGSLTFTLAALLILAYFESRSRLMAEARLGTAYAAAGAATILLLASDPNGEAQMVSILKGDILAATGSSLLLSVVVFGFVALMIVLFRRAFILISFDRELATILGMRAGVWDGLLYLLIGVVLSFGVMAAGPLFVFGFLVLPPLTVRPFVTRMTPFIFGSMICGGIAAFLGFLAAYAGDLPLGPAEVAVAALLYGVSALAANILPGAAASLPSPSLPPKGGPA